MCNVSPSILSLLYVLCKRKMIKEWACSSDGETPMRVTRKGSYSAVTRNKDPKSGIQSEYVKAWIRCDALVIHSWMSAIRNQTNTLWHALTKIILAFTQLPQKLCNWFRDWFPTLTQLPDLYLGGKSYEKICASSIVYRETGLLTWF